MQIRGKTILEIARIQNQFQFIRNIIPQTSFKTQFILLNYESILALGNVEVNLGSKLAKINA